ncbi:glutathione S-transferase [Pseudomonas helleri]|jgi:glutathione S-transferase|uniref:Glutathione S-transferase n=2 Tax=Pseudomonas helleri TaxID=1608996 RepID=A0A6A7Z190_9PSED|nr:glutathione S-transferase [Pseudomonas helleri]KMN23158.1 glutathione S-transferase [Pseudomonas helleri]MQT34529.1 glutathione S-transferase [Pseudomonas helleri]MQT72982.1 glutathione S-transferase [Pseudomonas helleri]MQT93129.1 glutathione S-transferase [Pseudomonas helleri]MQU19592.1 glutathione S-transferase [Pseudomonas helleri]
MTGNVLYSFRRCPYAMRARMALRYSGVPLSIVEVSLKAKPAEMLALSPKGTVPVLVCADGRVIEQSLEIMHWALAQYDPDNWLGPDSAALIEENDQVFKVNLDRYKYAIRYPEQPMEHYRAQGAAFLQRLEMMLEQTPYLAGDTLSLADIALAPFVRQFAHVDRDWFEQAPYPRLNAWLERFLASELFNAVMAKTA